MNLNKLISQYLRKISGPLFVNDIQMNQLNGSECHWPSTFEPVCACWWCAELRFSHAMQNQLFAFISVRNVDYGGLVSSFVFIYIELERNYLHLIRGDETNRTQIVVRIFLVRGVGHRYLVLSFIIIIFLYFFYFLHSFN